MNNQLTDERITDFIKGVGQLARLSLGTDNGNPYPPSEILSAFVELQKRRRADGANPVVYAYRACAEKRTKFDISGNWQFGNAVINADFPQILRPQCEDYEYLPLYVAPPALVVPPEPTESDIPSWLNGEKRLQWLVGAKWMREACRAATLQGSQPVSNRDELREKIRREHAEWSDKTFGDVGPIGPLKHLSKEALEAAADPSDPLEWADMQFLLWDAQRRMGISDEFITRAMIEKLAINKARQWPEPKDSEPRLHIKEQPVPAVQDECPAELLAFCELVIDSRITANAKANELWDVCRTAMLNQAPVKQPSSNDVIGWVRSDYNSDDKRDPNAPLFMLGSNDPSEAWGVKYIPLSGNSPVIPDQRVTLSAEISAYRQEAVKCIGGDV